MELELKDALLLGLFVAAVIFLVLLLACLVSFFVAGRNLSSFRKRRPKNKKKRKKWARQIKRMEKQRSTRLKLAVLFLFLGIGCGGGGFYARYFQMTNLDTKDSEALVQGYFLVNELEEQLDSLSETDNVKKVQANVYTLSARLASYGASLPDGRLSQDGVLLLKKLYKSMKELGLNLSSITESSIQDQGIVESYYQDIEKIRTMQDQVFDHFRINKSSLKQDT